MLLEEIREWATDYCELSDKFAILTGQTEKTAEFLGVNWRRPRDNNLCFPVIRRYALCTDDVPQVRDLLLSEGAFDQFHLPLIPRNKLKHCSEVGQMFFK